MSAHTPGPWQVGNERKHTVEIDGPQWLSLAKVYVRVEGEESSVGRANARLIAAAPDLLAQHQANAAHLKLLMQAIKAGDPQFELIIRVGDLARYADAAIAKATGGES